MSGMADITIATPVIAGDRLLIRTSARIDCIRKAFLAKTGR
jgi:hypothetical protein